MTLEDHVSAILDELGENTDREGLRETPKRYAKFLREFVTKPDFVMTTFASEGYDQMIVQTDIPFYSLCEHHMLPFFGFATVAYIPSGRIVGLSKLARTVEYCARGLQNQERITDAVANMLQTNLNARGVAVTLRAKHMCMEMRGVKSHSVWTTSSRLIGDCWDDINCRAELLKYIGDKK